MDFELQPYHIGSALSEGLIISNDASQSSSNFNSAKSAGNCICLTMCFYYLGKMAISLVLYQEIDERIHEALFLMMFTHDVLSSIHYLTLSVLSIHLKFEDISEQQQKVNLLSFNSSIVQIIIQELVSQYQPMNGLVIIDILEQKQFQVNLVFLKLLYYFISIFSIISIISSESSIPSLLEFYMLLLSLYLFVPIFTSVILGSLYIMSKVRKQNVHRNFHLNFIVNISDDLKEKQFNQLKEQQSIIDGVCAICFEEVNESHLIIQLPCHQQRYFHSNCCKQWLHKDGRCPICRTELQLQTKNIRLFN